MTKRTYTRNEAVAKKIQARKVMNRAWQIAKNAHNSLIADFKRIAKVGASYSAKEFFVEAIKLAWLEEKTGTTIYQMNGGLPRKVLPRIESALQRFIDMTQDVELHPMQANFEQASIAYHARYGKDIEGEDRQWLVDATYFETETSAGAVGEASDENYALTA